jgi:hypothetical protein
VTPNVCATEAVPAVVVKPVKVETEGVTLGDEDALPVSLISSRRIDAVPDFTKRIFSPLIWAPAGSERVLAGYQAAAEVVVSLNKFAAEFATVTHDDPFQ